MTEQRMKVDDGPAPAESEEALKCRVLSWSTNHLYKYFV